MNWQLVKEKIVNWLKREVKKAGSAGVVFGLSGGVDSAVVGVLCNDAFNENCLGLIMPCFSTYQEVKDAEFVAKKFGIKTEIINLDSIFLEFCKILNVDPKSKELYVVNIKPRLRMITLYHYANKLNYLVVGTGNKSELYIGYFTKYGDGGSDLLPIGDLTKTEVWEFARFLGIPEKIINKPPSAGLWRGQTDEGEVGIKYRALDNVIKNIENKKEVDDKELLKKITYLHKKSLHKLFPPKICKLSLLKLRL